MSLRIFQHSLLKVKTPKKVFRIVINGISTHLQTKVIHLHLAVNQSINKYLNNFLGINQKWIPMKKLTLLTLGSLWTFLSYAQLTPISSFGSNPGNLNMYVHIPNNMPSNAPLVLVLHGCTQSASSYASESDWNSLADEYGFYVIYAEQKSANNSSQCFNWFESGDITRGYG